MVENDFTFWIISTIGYVPYLVHEFCNDEVFLRSEFTNATAAADADYRYGYCFDDIGNRVTASERGTNTAYTANALNQYTSVGRGVPAAQPDEDVFTPQYYADGNETLVKTATGVWQITYNGENRPICRTCGTNTLVMSYDRMGRRVRWCIGRSWCASFVKVE